MNNHARKSSKANTEYDKVLCKYNNALPMLWRLTGIRQDVQQPEPGEPKKRGRPENKQVPKQV